MIQTVFIIPSFAPINMLLLGIIMGICALYSGISTIMIIMIAMIITALSLLFFKSSIRSTTLIVGIALIMLLGAYRYNTLLSSFNRFQELHTDNKLTLRGTVIDLEENPSSKHHPYLMRIRLQEVIHLDDTRYDHNGIIAIHTTSAHKNQCFIDDTIIISAIKLPKMKRSDLVHYFCKEQLLATVYTQKLDLKREIKPLSAWYNSFNATKKTLYESLRSKMEGATFRLFSSLYLGKQSHHEHDYQTMRQHHALWGTAHYLARSGLHLVLCVGIWSYILRFFPISLAIKQLILIFIILIYSAMSWTSISYYRALIPFLIYHYCTAQYLPVQAVHLLIIACVGMLIYNPFYLFSLDFQLSFLLAGALLIYNAVKHQKKLLISSR